MNFNYEALALDSLKWRVKKRHLRKINGLRKKYGPFWVAREELFIWRFPINSSIDGSYNKMGMTLLNLLFKLHIKPKIRACNDNYDLGLVDSAHTVLKSYKIFYFFFSYIDKILKYIPIYPVGLFNRLTYKMCYRFFRMYFVFKPYWKHSSKLYELILGFINVKAKIKIYILDNSHLNASYLARYIITCLRAKFDYRDTMIPIRRTLLKIMLSRRWRPIRDFKKKSWQIYLERYKLILKDRVYFHLITNSLVRMFFYRLKIMKKFKRLVKRQVSKRYLIFNFYELKKNFYSIKEFFFKVKKDFLIKFNKMKFFFK